MYTCPYWTMLGAANRVLDHGGRHPWVQGTPSEPMTGGQKGSGSECMDYGSLPRRSLMINDDPRGAVAIFVPKKTTKKRNWATCKIFHFLHKHSGVAPGLILGSTVVSQWKNNVWNSQVIGDISINKKRKGENNN